MKLLSCRYETTEAAKMRSEEARKHYDSNLETLREEIDDLDDRIAEQGERDAAVDAFLDECVVSLSGGVGSSGSSNNNNRSSNSSSIDPNPRC